jgi:hypothetical protein
MLPALVIAAVLAAPASSAARLDALRHRYDAVWADVNRPRILTGTMRERLMERVAVAMQTVDALAKEPNDDVLGDLERRADLDERAVPALLTGTAPPLDAAPGAHAGIARAGDHDEPFAYWVPRGYDPRKPGPLVTLLHGATQPETDLVARAFFRDLADATGAVLLAPGGDDRDADAMARSVEAAQRAVAPVVASDPRRSYIGGFSNGVFCAYHTVAIQRQRYAGFLGIAGFVRRDDLRAVGAQLSGEGAYIVEGADDTIISPPVVRATVRMLRGQHVYARYYEVARAPHALRPLYAAIAKAWNDMLAGVTRIDDDGLGGVSDSF